MPTALETVEVLFREDEDGIYAMVEGRRARVSAFSINSVSEGQSWKCMIDRKERFKPELIPTELVSEKTKEEPVSIVGPVHEIDEQSTSTESVRIDEAEHLEEIRKLRDRNAELRRELGIAEGYKDLCEEKDAEIRNLDRKVKSLSSKKMMLYSDYKDDKLTREEYVKRSKAMVEQIDELHQEIEQLKTEIPPEDNSSSKFETQLESIINMESFDREKIQKVIKKVIINGEDNIEIVWQQQVAFAMVFSITHRCVNFIKASCYSI